LRDDPEEKLHWIWHGGEPMLMGAGFYEDVLAAQRRAFGAEVERVTNSIQTNLSLLTPEWIPTLKALLGERGSVGTSFDVIPGIRRLAGGDYDDAWLRATRLLSRSGVRSGVVYVVHRRSLGRAPEIYRYFRNLQPRGGLRANPIYAQGMALDGAGRSLHITPEEYAGFLVEMGEEWESDGQAYGLAPLDEWRRAWLGDPGALCCDARGVCWRTHIGIAGDGSVYGCGRSIDSGLACYGNILRDPIEAILAHSARHALAERSAALREACCADCEWWPLCRGGCPNDGLLSYGDVMRETGWCEAKKAVFRYLEGKLGPMRLPMSEPDCPQVSSLGVV
jgi:uncharacterized protein